MKLRSEKMTETFKKIFGEHLEIYCRQTKEIVSCSHCKGTGWTSREELSDYHRGEYRDVHEECTFCKGEGRLTRTHDVVRISPYYASRVNSHEFATYTDVPFSEDPLVNPHASVFHENERIPIE